MKNVEKIMTAMEIIMTAMKKAFSGHKIEISYNFNSKIYSVFIDDNYVGNFEGRFCEQDFEDRFCEQDFEKAEIEIKIKAPLYNIKNFLEEVECDGVFYHAVERGLKEWEKGSQRNS